ncbi:MAG: FixH family protein, partial [Paracoccaceae bacterium]
RTLALRHAFSGTEIMTHELTGRHVLAIACAAFAIIIAANMTMLFAATGTFPGLVVKNAYVASQGWNARTSAQQALGWKADIAYVDGAVRLSLTDRAGAPVETNLAVTIGRPTTDSDDKRRTVRVQGGVVIVPIQLAPGTWRIDVLTSDGGYRRSARIQIPGGS